MENQFDSIACEVKLIRELADQPNVDDEEVCLKPVRNGPQVQLQTGESTTENPSASEGTSNLVGQRMDHSEAADSSVSFDESKQIENQLLYLFPCIDVFAIPFFVVFFCNDVFVNILLAKSYYDDGMTFECILTASVVATAFLVTGILNLFWHTQEKHRRNICLFGSDVPIFATIERNTIYLYYVYKSKKNGIKKHDYYERMIKSNHYASLLRMIYAFIESVPQLVLQFYLIVKEHENPKDCEDISIYRHIIRRSSVLFSWVSVTWSVTASYQAIRVSNAMYKPRQKTVFAATGCFLWRAFEIGPRVMALVMLILVNSFGFAVTVVFHWIAMVTWSFATTEMRLYKKTYENIIFILFVGFVQIFSFMIFRPSKSQEDAKSTNPNKTRKDAKNDNSIQTEYHALFYYFFVYIENTIILILWILVKNNSFCPWIYHRSIGIVSGGLICNIVFMIFYKLCNPKASIW